MTSAISNPLYHPLVGDEIRVITLQEPEGMKCGLVTVKLPRARQRPADPLLVKFVALSYAWGDMHDTVEIDVNGHIFPVTRNLYSALFQLQQSRDLVECLRGVSYLWVDAICIDQQNVVEKSQQVPRMRDIYRCASDVVIWLGTCSPAIRPSISHLFYTVNSMTPNDSAGNPPIFSQSNQQLYDIVSAAFRTHLKAAGSHTHEIGEYALYLFEQSWFWRVWVVQESALPARSPMLMVGDLSIQLDSLLLFFLAFDYVMDSTDRSFTSLLLMGNRWYSRRPPGRGFYAATTNLAVTELHGLLAEIGGRQATLPHDTLYGILSLVELESLPTSLTPNYALPFQDVFRDYSKYLYAETGNLVLRHTKRRQLPATVPTWVADFRYRSPDQVYRINSQGNITFSEDGSTMRLDAIKLGEIKVVHSRGPEFPPNESVEEVRHFFKSYEKALFSEAAKVIGFSQAASRREWLASWYMTTRLTEYERFISGDNDNWRDWSCILQEQHFVTETGMIGHGYQSDDVLEPRQLVYGLQGSPAAAVLCPSGDAYTWIGTCSLGDDSFGDYGRLLSAEENIEKILIV